MQAGVVTAATPHAGYESIILGFSFVNHRAFGIIFRYRKLCPVRLGITNNSMYVHRSASLRSFVRASPAIRLSLKSFFIKKNRFELF